MVNELKIGDMVMHSNDGELGIIVNIKFNKNNKYDYPYAVKWKSNINSKYPISWRQATSLIRVV